MITQLRIKAKADSLKISDTPLIKEGAEYNGIQTNGIVMIDCDGLVVIQEIDKQLKSTFDIVSEQEVEDVQASNIESINRHMKRAHIKDWVLSNTSPNQVLRLEVTEDKLMSNHANNKQAGSEFFNKGEVFVGIVREDRMVMLQKRKGNIFYVPYDQLSSYFTVQTFDEKDYTYENMKEVHYIINADYQPRVVK